MRNTVSPQDLRNLVCSKIVEFNASNEIFTAFDVTRSIRQDNPTDDIDHQAVRKIVRGLYDCIDLCFDGMVCSQVLIGEIKQQALCYHKPSQNPDDHPAVVGPADDDTDTMPGTTSVPSPVTSSVDSPSGRPSFGNLKEFLASIENTGRLNIPSPAIREWIGAYPGDKVFVTRSSPDVLEISTDGQPSSKVFTVSARGNIRLGEALLKDAFGPGRWLFKCCNNGGSISIEAKGRSTTGS